LTYANIRDGKVKYKTIRKSKLLLLCTNLLDHIKDLELRHEEELKEAKVEKAKVEKEAAPTGDDDDDGTTTSNGEAGEEDVMGVEEGDNVNVKVNATSNKSKSAKLAKLVKLAKSTSLWCLSPHVPPSQEARDKDKQRQGRCAQ
jgi:Tfp pilus assembly protein PilV